MEPIDKFLELRIVGLKVHYYIGKKVTDGYKDFEYTDEKLKKYIICLEEIYTGMKYELELYEEYGECSSGYTTAKWGRFKLTKVDNFGALTHLPKEGIKKEIKFDLKKDEDDYTCEWFSFSMDGNDYYYPDGYVSVNMDKFIATPRGFEDHPVWIFKGESNLGKSYLAHKINHMEIFETDAYQKLPEKINCDIVVVGNKYKHTLEDILTRINGKAIIVQFNNYIASLFFI